jgi:hypothetical protein
MIESLLKNCAFDRVKNAEADAATAITDGDILDLQNFDSVCAIALLNDVDVSCVPILKAYTGDEAALGDGAYETNTAGGLTATDTDHDNLLLVLDIVKPGKRYVRFDMTRAGGNLTLDGIVAIRYNARNIPVTQGSDVVDSEINVN